MNKMKFFIATKNQHKMQEFARILEDTDIELINENSLDFPLEDVEETGETFEDNAILKALGGMHATGLPTIADDSGLCVDYLGGAPGIHSARFAGGHGDDKANNDKLLSLLNGVDKKDRTAQFVCVIACVFPDGRRFTVMGKCEGYIDDKLNGEGGFGYDPLLVTNKGCFGTISAEEKNAISHRGIAIKLFEEEIKKYI